MLQVGKPIFLPTLLPRFTIPFIDQVLRTVSLQADTSLRGFSFGLRVSYDDRQSFVGQQTGSTQFQVGLFGQLDFGTADFPIGSVR